MMFYGVKNTSIKDFKLINSTNSLLMQANVLMLPYNEIVVGN